VLDEVHAYDIDVTSLTLAAGKFLVNEMGVRAFITTATLPAHLGAAVRGILGDVPIIRPEADVMDRAPRHRLVVLPFDSQSSEAEALILARAREGSVLVVVNQGRRARRLYDRLRRKLADVSLLHSRFTYADRAAREKDVTPSAGRILIGTQAVEVSLDVSFDCCYSELAPMESLLQRFGRCNRRGEHSAGSQVGVFQRFPGDERHGYLPYEEEHLASVLGVIRRFLAGRAEGELWEREIGDLINQSYPEYLRTRLGDTIQRRSAEIRASLIDSFEPWGMGDESAVRRLGEEWEKLFDGEEVLPAGLESLAAREETWAGKARHLVPISSRQYSRLKREGKVARSNADVGCAVAEVAYDDMGLDL
jgi:CRISPR-associated endonuclease/helicase Cas3